MKQQKLLRLVTEMLKNSKKSDRELAGILGVSQPTVSRTRARIEKEYIKTYTIIPDLEKLGYQIIAFTLAKKASGKEVAAEIEKRSKEWVEKHPNVIFGAEGEGFAKDLVLVSFHKNYSAYVEFMRSLAKGMGTSLDNFESFLVSVKSSYKIRDLNLKYLADDL